jgi:hypothetical protein
MIKLPILYFTSEQNEKSSIQGEYEQVNSV